ncbi:hypothetical protein [Vibrio europaeus]|uniref:Uncharacterized protein n=2 Tax=Vibrio TaxID=662 RepID=A0ABT5H0V1_9VIBR|nr:hypothetical protein [Vibrio europaeus]MDC5727107.1 hypothetical protein [Vibrio europaeus]MDC5730116.1 hypothetical protein [Vibrio europaeus]MDC5735143.1 hypothetical protein [Vibrio europaeus]MDC5743035.1 hypothetical protein [Vibrio europaeus]MDC5748011.1 hypothetical protein [Vibrio europaeus]
MNKSRRGRPARTVQELTQKQAEKLEKAIVLVRSIEDKEGREEMADYVIFVTPDPTLNKQKGVGHTGRPQNTEIDEIEAMIRRIKKRITAIETGKEPSGRIMSADEKILGCQQQISDLEAQVKALEEELSDEELAKLQIRRARYAKRAANMHLKAIKAARDDEHKLVRDNLNIDEELLEAINNANAAAELVDKMVDEFNEKYGEIKNSEKSEGFVSKQILRNQLASKHAKTLMAQRKLQVEQEREERRLAKRSNVSVRNRHKNDTSVEIRFRDHDKS